MEPDSAPDYAALPAEALLDALEGAGRKPPPALLQATLDRGAEVTPRLLEWLEAGSDEAWPDDDPRGYREIHAGHLLIALREPAALPLFAALYRDPEREDALSEWFTGELPAYGPLLTPTLLSLLEDPGNEWAWASALDMLGTVGQLHPEEATRILPSVRAILPSLRDDGSLSLDTSPEDVSDEDVMQWTWAIATLMDLRDQETRPQVEALFDADLVDESFIGDAAHYRREMDGEGRSVRPPVGLLAYYEQLWDGVSGRTPREAEDWHGLMEALDEDEAAPRYQEPVRVAPPPGRNAPCPCGSGRKYKHCCGRA
jgi:hypothetical protein